MHLDHEATLAMLADLRDGDKPVRPGDSITDGQGRVLVCSRVYGWKGTLRVVEREDGTRFKSGRSLKVTWFVDRAKRAETLWLNPRTDLEDSRGEL